MNRFFFLSVALGLLNGCAKTNESQISGQPVVASLKQTTLQSAQETRGDQPGKPAGSVITEATLSKSQLLNKTYLYGSSLQFSSIVENEISTAMMALSLGELPATFQILDNKLRLLTDARINFESDVNHPSRLIQEFEILKQDAETITIRLDRASPALDSVLFGKTNKVPVRYSFVRSLESAENGRLLLIESSIELTDGSLAEFMETIRPREDVVPADAKAIYADEALNSEASRYRFLDAGDVYIQKKERERIKTKAAQRFLIRNGQPVKWYVTSNIPDAYINDVKNSVEAWNRYSKAAGMPDLVKFEGRLPEGIKVGDPRYNLIVWDSVQEAGAAYESQNSDPLTGIQSHSMIYIPYAWVNIGKDYWNKMSPENQEPGELRAERLTKLLKSRSLLGRALPVNCIDSAEMHLTLDAKVKPEQFARGLLKGVIFHEMGHAMGLAHNFKGSLSHDSDDPKKAFSTSIMDYNHYNEEEEAFFSLDSADGPLLEYDRQIISVLYNDSKDVKETDPNLPACADDEADSLENGVDPLCIRYDIGSDVTVEAGRALKLFTEAGSRRAKMDAVSAQRLIDSLLGLPPAANVKTKEDLLKALVKAQAQVAGTISIYLASSANSFGYLGSAAMKSLKVFQKDILPEEYDETAMRERALSLLETVAAMDEFPSLLKDSLAATKPKVLEYLGSTSFVTELPKDSQAKIVVALAPLVDKLFRDLETALISKMRTRFIMAVASTPTAPLAFHERNGAKVDVELAVMKILENLASEKAGSVNRPLTERLAALKSLKSYSRSEHFDAISERLSSALNQEIRGSTDALRKESLRKLLAEFEKEEKVEEKAKK